MRRETRIDATNPAQRIRGGNIDEDDKGGVIVLDGEIICVRDKLTLLNQRLLKGRDSARHC